MALLLGACGSPSGGQRTVTVNATVTSGAESSGATGSGSVSPVESGSTDAAAPSSGDPAATSGTSDAPPPSPTDAPTPTPSPTPASSTAPAPIIPVDPLKNDCGALLNAADVKRTLNFDITDTRARIVDVANPDRNITGRTKCVYGTADSKTGDVTINLTQYSDAEAMRRQVETTVNAERDVGATVTPTAVQGFESTILLREGGLLVLPYDTWTLSIVVANGKADDATLTAGLPQLADTVLTRVLKNG
jgi:hypothetical protein